jgi:hypothetical protein
MHRRSPPRRKSEPRRPANAVVPSAELISKVQALVVGTREAQIMGGWGKTKLFELIRTGELESFMDGSVRRITTASIHARIQRKLQESGVKTAQSGEPAAP